MKILWISGCWAKRDQKYILENERHNVQFAAQKVCSMLLRGIRAAGAESVDLIYGLRVSNFPKFRKLLAFNLPPYREATGNEGRYAAYITLPGICYLSTIFSVFFEIARWHYRNAKAKERFQILYGLTFPYAIPTLVGRLIWKTPYAIIIPDLPAFTNPSQGPLGKVLRKINQRILGIVTFHADVLILFSTHMKEQLAISQHCVIEIVEGCVEPEMTVPVARQVKSNGRRIIFYSGILLEVYGVKNLVDAFSLWKNSDWELWLCGDGDLVEYIKNLAKHDSRIKFLGRLPNEQVVALQQQAGLLINPRGNEYEWTRYSFPSKNLEYLASGRPVAWVRLGGIPEEYNEYVFLLDSNSVSDIQHLFQEIAAMPEEELTRRGKRGQEFVLKQKNFYRQGEKILNAMNIAQKHYK